MFNCYNHGWSHIERECPKCFPAYITTTTSTTFILPDAIVGINKSELDRLKAENARYREALEKIEGFTMSRFMGPNDMALECKMVAREALKGE